LVLAGFNLSSDDVHHRSPATFRRRKQHPVYEDSMAVAALVEFIDATITEAFEEQRKDLQRIEDAVTQGFEEHSENLKGTVEDAVAGGLQEQSKLLEDLGEEGKASHMAVKILQREVVCLWEEVVRMRCAHQQDLRGVNRAHETKLESSEGRIPAAIFLQVSTAQL
jgi:hypothetical protein